MNPDHDRANGNLERGQLLGKKTIPLHNVTTMSTDVIWNSEEGDSFHWIFTLLVLYRWLSLIPPFIFIIIDLSTQSLAWPHIAALITAVTLNSVISLFAQPLNQALRARPWLLLLDLLLVAGLIALSGGQRTAYYLYAMSPLIVSAFFFQLRGALITTSIFVPLYLAANLAGHNWLDGRIDWLESVVNLVGFYLISSAFGSASVLLSRWRLTNQEVAATNERLAAAHRDLQVTHDLTMALHNSADVEAVQDQVLLALTSELGFRRAVVGLVDIEEQAITGWLGRVNHGQTSDLYKPLHPAKLPLSAESGPAIAALLAGHTYRATDEACTVSKWINEQFGMQGCLVIPMRWGIQPVGILMVENAQEEMEDDTRLQTLEAIAQQTAVALGMMMTRLRRARESAIDAERARLALDIHDTVSQSLFGVVFTLDGLLKMWPGEPEVVRAELEQTLRAAESVRQELRQTIHDLWEEAITAAAFEENLRKYVTDVLQAHQLNIRFDIRGDFSALSSKARRSLYRMSQESLANVVQHAAANEARVCIDVETERASLVISDDGRGFEPAVALNQNHEQGHFGLRGMQERARSLGGTCDIFSQPEAGASIVIDIPNHT